MSDTDRNLTDADVAALATAIRGEQPKTATQAINDALRADATAKKQRGLARVLGRINKPAPSDD